ncbi:hemolysin-III family protein [Nemania abortiva]|nr:hemolysin-III family protein [Nemania abortiva]
MASALRFRVLPPQPLEVQKGRGMESIRNTALKAGKARRPWIRRGYRWSYIHNESVNIYSHLIPAVSFLKHFCRRLDMLGVVIFILGDLVLGIYMVFWCEPLPHSIYWSMDSKYRLFRALMFVATSLSGVAPLIHGVNVFGISQMTRKAFPYTLVKAGYLPSGTSFYATRFPESRYPGNFYLWGSYSIFHIPVVCAAVVQLMGYLDAFDYAHANFTCSPL